MRGNKRGIRTGMCHLEIVSLWDKIEAIPMGPNILKPTYYRVRNGQNGKTITCNPKQFLALKCSMEKLATVGVCFAEEYKKEDLKKLCDIFATNATVRLASSEIRKENHLKRVDKEEHKVLVMERAINLTIGG